MLNIYSLLNSQSVITGSYGQLVTSECYYLKKRQVVKTTFHNRIPKSSPANRIFCLHYDYPVSSTRSARTTASFKSPLAITSWTTNTWSKEGHVIIICLKWGRCNAKWKHFKYWWDPLWQIKIWLGWAFPRCHLESGWELIFILIPVLSSKNTTDSHPW